MYVDDFPGPLNNFLFFIIKLNNHIEYIIISK